MILLRHTRGRQFSVSPNPLKMSTAQYNMKCSQKPMSVAGAGLQCSLTVPAPSADFHVVADLAREEVLTFTSASSWARWLRAKGSSSGAVWLRLARKGSPLRTLSYQEALEEALCHGWVDGQKRALDDDAWLQRFSRRGPRSTWSQINREKATQLIEAGRMSPEGLAAVNAARAAGRWKKAYSSQAAAKIPADLASALEAHPDAAAFFATLDSRNRFAILFRLHQAAKAETRRRRLDNFVQMLKRHEKIHP